MYFFQIFFFYIISEEYLAKTKLLSYDFCVKLSLALGLLTLKLHFMVKLHRISSFDLILS